MYNVEEMDNKLYKAIYVSRKKEDYHRLWSKIKNNSDMLMEAIQIKRTKFDERDIVKGLVISNMILIDHQSIDSNVYKKLIDTIYSNKDIARLVIDGAANGGFSFLLLSLLNHNLELSEEQKNFAVDEAMNKNGTTRWLERKKDFYIEDDYRFVMIGNQLIDINYMNFTIATLSDELAHGIGEYDIRYHILRNSNWSLDEKKKLIMDFWYDDEVYDEQLELWEWGIVNDQANYKDNNLSLIFKSELYEYTYDALLKFYNNKEVTDRIWEEIQFCKQMHQLRPQQWELQDNINEKKLIKSY